LAVADLLALCHEGHYDMNNSPYTVCLSVELVESADILPPRLIDTDDICQVLDDWTAEVEGEVGAVVVASSRPRLVPGIFTCFLGVFG